MGEDGKVKKFTPGPSVAASEPAKLSKMAVDLGPQRKLTSSTSNNSFISGELASCALRQHLTGDKAYFLASSSGRKCVAVTLFSPQAVATTFLESIQAH